MSAAISALIFENSCFVIVSSDTVSSEGNAFLNLSIASALVSLNVFFISLKAFIPLQKMPIKPTNAVPITPVPKYGATA